MVALIKVSNSSSPRMANCKCLGVILFTFRSFDALPANSRIVDKTEQNFNKILVHLFRMY